MYLSKHPTWRWSVLGFGLWLGVPVGTAGAAPTEPLTLSHALVPATECEYCHTFHNPPAAADEPLYAPVFSWRGSMMANSAVDPVFWAGVTIASQDAVDPEETTACIRCHAPRASVEGRGSASSPGDLTVHDRAGIECEICHRMVADMPPGDGQFTFDDVLVGNEVPRRGPWDYPAQGSIPTPPHETVVDPFVGSSELCGTCHDVTTDRERVDEHGVGQGVGFGEQRTYSEWAKSAYAVPGPGFASCQDCHMPAVDDAAGCREHNMKMHTHPEGARRHDLLGANRFVIEMLAAEVGFPDTTAFDHSLNLIDEFLRTSATLEVQGPAHVQIGAGLSDLAITVTNETGHKLPTGYSEGRVMWLEVSARVGEDLVWWSGQWDPEAQEIIDDPQLDDPTPEDPSDDTLLVTVRLLYLVNTRAYIQFLADDNETNDAGQTLAQRFETAGGATPLVLAEQTLDIPILSFGEPVEDADGESETTDVPPDPTSSTGDPMTPPGGAEATDAGNGDAMNDEVHTGCSCRTSHATLPLGQWGLWLAVLWAWRRTGTLDGYTRFIVSTHARGADRPHTRGLLRLFLCPALRFRVGRVGPSPSVDDRARPDGDRGRAYRHRRLHRWGRVHRRG